MKNGLLALFLLLPTLAFGALSETDKALLPYVNKLTNPGFELSTSGWTVSSGAFSATTTAANKDSGNASGSWAATNTATLTSNSFTITSGDGYSSQNGVLSCRVKGGTGAITHTIGLWDGTTLTPTGSFTSTTSYQRVTVNVPYAASGTQALRITGGGTETLYIDNCVNGLASGFNISQVSQSTLVGTAYIPTTASCLWSASTTSVAAMGTTAACPGPTVDQNPGPGTIQTTDADLPRFTVNNLPPGTYRVRIAGKVDNNTNANIMAFAINDGTTTSPLYTSMTATNAVTTGFVPMVVEAWFTYATTANRSFEVYASAAASSARLDVQASNSRLTFVIERFPTTTEMAYRTDNAPASWSGYHDTTCAWARTNTAYGAFASDASCALTQRQNRNFGTVTGTNTTPTITWTPPGVGRYWVCANITAWEGNTTGNTGGIRMTDGTTVVAESEFRDPNTSVTAYTRVPVCGIYNATSLSSVALTLEGKSTAGVITMGSANTGSAIEWTLFQLDVPLATPFLVGGVTSNTTGSERIERLYVTNSGTPTIASQSGSWVTSLTDVAAGVTTVNIAAGTFSGTPSCACITEAAGVRLCGIINTLAPSSTAVRFNTTSTAGADTDMNFNVICMGPR